jgi:hypothetical protein
MKVHVESAKTGRTYQGQYYTKTWLEYSCSRNGDKTWIMQSDDKKKHVRINIDGADIKRMVDDMPKELKMDLLNNLTKELLS